MCVCVRWEAGVCTRRLAPEAGNRRCLCARFDQSVSPRFFVSTRRHNLMVVRLGDLIAQATNQCILASK